MQEDRSAVPQDIAAYIDKIDRDEDDAEEVHACVLLSSVLTVVQ